GIRTFTLLGLMTLVILSFWGWLFLWDNASIFDRGAFQRYLLCNEFLLIGVLFGLSGKRERVVGPHHEFVAAIRLTGSQTVFGLLGVFLAVFALHDTVVSRPFLFSYIPWLFLTLLFSNYMVPKWLARWAFSGIREERVALVGTVGQADQIKPWIERKNLLGLRTIGVGCPQP